MMKTTRRHFFFSLFAAAVVFVGTGIVGSALAQTTSTQQTDSHKTLIIFFSKSGNIKNIATQIHQKVGGDMIAVELVEPYPETYEATLAAFKEEKANGIKRELKTKLTHLAQYDVVFFGSPIWGGGLSLPMATLLGQYDFSGKTIIPFFSHGGGGLKEGAKDIARLAPKARVLEPLLIHRDGGNALSQDIEAWLGKVGH